MNHGSDPSRFLGLQTDRAVRLLGRQFAGIPELTTTTIAHVQTDGDGRPSYAITAEGYRLDLSLGMPIKEGDEWLIRGEGGAAGRQWYAVARVNTTSDLLGPMDNRWIPMPIVPIQSFGGWVSIEEGNSRENPGGVPRAQAYIFPRTIVQGFAYDVYGQHFPDVVWRMRRLGADDWERQTRVPIEPKSPADMTLTNLGGVGPSSPGAWSVDVSDATIQEIPQNRLLFWLIDDETVIGTLAGNTLTIDTRGADGTTAAAHSQGSLIRLGSGKVHITGLDPGVTYEVAIAFGDAFNATGPFGDPIEIVSWEQATRPAAPTGVSVKIDNGNWHVKWNPVPDASVTEYHVYRYDGDTMPTDGNLTPPTVHTDLGYVKATTFLVPVAGVNTGTGRNFGVAAKNTSGLESTISWGNDTWIPPSPNIAQVEIISAVGGVTARVLDLAPLAFSGFRNFLLWQGDTTAAVDGGAAPNDARMIFRFPKGSTEQFFPIADYNVLHTYQVTSQAYNENRSLPVTTAGAWQWGASLQPLPGSPPNGNFEIPNAVADAPAGWTLTDAVGYDWRYGLQGGIRGSAAVSLVATIASPGSPSPNPELRASSAYRIPFNWRRPTVIEFWIYNPGGVTTSAAVVDIGFSAFRHTVSPDFTFGVFVGPLTAIGVSNWEKVPLTIAANAILGTDASGNPMRYAWFDRIYWFMATAPLNAAITIDDIVLVQT